MRMVYRFLPLDVVPGLAALWLVCTAAIAALAQLPFNDVRSAAAAVPLALLLYMASDPLEMVFNRWYGSERPGTRLKKGKSALLPSGRDLDDARRAAIHTLPAPAGRYEGEGVYQRAKELIQQRSKAEWLKVAAFSTFNKLCRGLAVASLFVVVGAVYLLAFHEQLKNGAFGTGAASFSVQTLAAVIPVGTFFAGVFFLGFVKWKWEHMVGVYRLAVKRKRPAARS